MVDLDAKFAYSKIVVLNIKSDGIIAVNPNPATTQVKLELAKNISGKVDLEIFDISGRLVRRDDFTVYDTNITIPVDKLPGGTYFITLSNNDIKYYTKIVVSK